MKLTRKHSTLWLWICISIIAVGLIVLTSVNSVLSFRPSSRITALSPCETGEEDFDFVCNGEADFDSDFEGHPEFVARCNTDDCQTQSQNLSCCQNQSSQVAIAASIEAKIWYKGVNLVGSAFLGGVGERLPLDNDAALFIWKGMNIFRIPIQWEEMADIRGNLKVNTEYIVRLDELVTNLAIRNVFILLDLHNFMRYNPENFLLNELNTDPEGEDVIGHCTANCNRAPSREDFIRLWINIATRYHSPNMLYGLMNEPHDVSADELTSLFAETIASIRALEEEENFIKHQILVSGNQRSNLSFWFNPLANNRSNAQTIESLLQTQPLKKYLSIEVHQNFDVDLSGRYLTEECMDRLVFRAQFESNWVKFMNWSISNNVSIFVGSFGVPDTPNCRAILRFFLDTLELFPYSKTTGSGVIGWTAWAAGAVSDSAYPLALGPGGKANELMWDTNGYGLPYITQLPINVKPLSQETRAISIWNTLSIPLQYLRGYLPFQFRGSANIAAGEAGYLYSNNNDNTPIGPGGLEIEYFAADKVRDRMVFGFSPLPDHAVFFTNERNSQFNIRVAENCPIQVTNGPNRGEERCFAVRPRPCNIRTICIPSRVEGEPNTCYTVCD